MWHGLVAALIVLSPCALGIWWQCYGKPARDYRRSRKTLWIEFELLMNQERRRRESREEDEGQGQGV